MIENWEYPARCIIRLLGWVYFNPPGASPPCGFIKTGNRYFSLKEDMEKGHKFIQRALPRLNLRQLGG
jgi:hypothetical protein